MMPPPRDQAPAQSAALSAALLTRLEDADQLRSIAAEEVEQARAAQREGLARLLARADAAVSRGDRLQAYLNTYDTLMRRLELQLLALALPGGGVAPPYQLGPSAHAGLRSLAPLLWGISLEELTPLIAARHQAKKQGVTPSAAELSALMELVKRCVSAS